MKKEDEVYFSKKMHELADKFNDIVKALDIAKALDAPGADGEKALKMMADGVEFLGQVETEFERAGYSRREWCSLLRSSGAAIKLPKR